ncbi:hypothetical protein HPP92_028609, partial [Vanilla planifolia]
VVLKLIADSCIHKEPRLLLFTLTISRCDTRDKFGGKSKDEEAQSCLEPQI